MFFLTCPWVEPKKDIAVKIAMFQEQILRFLSDIFDYTS